MISNNFKLKTKNNMYLKYGKKTRNRKKEVENKNGIFNLKCYKRIVGILLLIT